MGVGCSLVSGVPMLDIKQLRKGYFIQTEQSAGLTTYYKPIYPKVGIIDFIYNKSNAE